MTSLHSNFPISQNNNIINNSTINNNISNITSNNNGNFIPNTNPCQMSGSVASNSASATAPPGATRENHSEIERRRRNKMSGYIQVAN